MKNTKLIAAAAVASLMGYGAAQAAAQTAAPSVACRIHVPSGTYLVSDTYEYKAGRSDVCYNAGLLVFSGSTVTLVGRTRCTDDNPGSHTSDYVIPGTFVFEKSRCAATATFAEGADTIIEMRLFFEKTGLRFRGSYFDDRGVGGMVGERQ